MPRLSSAPRFCSSWATLLAPIRADVTRGSRRLQPRASWARVCPRRAAIWFNARTLARVSSRRKSVDNDPGWLALEPAGTPAR